MPLLIVSLIAQAASAAQKAQADKAAGVAAQNVGDTNAAIDQSQATVDLQQANFEAQNIRAQNQRVAGSQRSTYLASGITLEGTPTDVMYDSALQGELEALTTQYKGQVASSFMRKQAVLDQYGGATRAYSYDAAATGDILQGIGSGISIYSNPNFKKAA